VLAFAIVRDSFTGPAARIRFAYVNARVAVAPMVAPTLGSFIYALWGWRAILALLTAAAAAVAVVMSVAFEESLAPANRISLSPVMSTFNLLALVTFLALAFPSKRRTAA
jgi:MFS transporter, DHA1 family, multidrug resistance protein